MDKSIFFWYNVIEPVPKHIFMSFLSA